MSFIPDEFEVPVKLITEAFRLEPLGPEHNERDHEAWMSSIEHIRSTPGFPNGHWPSAMSLERNLIDIERHMRDFDQRRGFTYSVLDGDEVIGCVYIYPPKAGNADAEVQSWVTVSRSELDVLLWQTVSNWISERWPFDTVTYAARKAD